MRLATHVYIQLEQAIFINYNKSLSTTAANVAVTAPMIHLWERNGRKSVAKCDAHDINGWFYALNGNHNFVDHTAYIRWKF